MLNAILTAFLADPIKAILGSGGFLGSFVLLIRWLRGRASMRVRIISETFDTKAAPTMEVVIQVEVENTGREAAQVR